MADKSILISAEPSDDAHDVFGAEALTQNTKAAFDAPQFVTSAERTRTLLEI